MNFRERCSMLRSDCLLKRIQPGIPVSFSSSRQTWPNARLTTEVWLSGRLVLNEGRRKQWIVSLCSCGKRKSAGGSPPIKAYSEYLSWIVLRDFSYLYMKVCVLSLYQELMKYLLNEWNGLYDITAGIEWQRGDLKSIYIFSLFSKSLVPTFSLTEAHIKADNCEMIEISAFRLLSGVSSDNKHCGRRSIGCQRPGESTL